MGKQKNKMAHRTISNSDWGNPNLRNFYGKWKMSDKEEKSILKDMDDLWESWKINQ